MVGTDGWESQTKPRFLFNELKANFVLSLTIQYFKLMVILIIILSIRSQTITYTIISC